MSENRKNNNDTFKSALKEQLQDYKHAVKDGMFDDIENSLAKLSSNPKPKRNIKSIVIWISSAAALLTGFMFAAPYVKDIVAELDIPIINEWIKPSNAKKKDASMKNETEQTVVPESDEEIMDQTNNEEVIEENNPDETNSKTENNVNDAKNAINDKKVNNQSTEKEKSKAAETNLYNEKKAKANREKVRTKKDQNKKEDVISKNQPSADVSSLQQDAKLANNKQPEAELPKMVVDTTLVLPDSTMLIAPESIDIEIEVDTLVEVKKNKVKKDYSSWSIAVSSRNMVYNGYRKQWGMMELPAEPVTEEEVLGWRREFSAPININLMVRKQLNKRFAIESGFSYTYLWSKEITINSLTPSTNINIEVHNLGIPIAMEYMLHRSSKMEIYGKWGALVEKTDGKNLRMGEWQFSTSLSGGIGYRLARHWGVFAEPGLSYYFDNGTQLPTLRNEAPLNFNIMAGIRFYPFVKLN